MCLKIDTYVSICRACKMSVRPTCLYHRNIEMVRASIMVKQPTDCVLPISSRSWGSITNAKNVYWKYHGRPSEIDTRQLITNLRTFHWTDPHVSLVSKHCIQ